MGHRFAHWTPRSPTSPKNEEELRSLLLTNRAYEPIARLEYGDHGLQAAEEAISEALRTNQRIALYADYDVDGTMSCVCWIWFLQAIGYTNFIHYIPCRFREGYGLNLEAMHHLIQNEKVQVVLTMDTGITANAEALYCRDKASASSVLTITTFNPKKCPTASSSTPNSTLIPTTKNYVVAALHLFSYDDWLNNSPFPMNSGQTSSL